jgi:hypothetical protein
MKVEDLVRDSLQELGVQAAEQPITSDQIQTGIRYTNRMMTSLDYLNLGFTIVDDASDEITVPPFCDEWMVKALAVRLSPQFGGTSMLPIIMEDRDTAYANMLMQLVEVDPSCYPSRLPVGAGNQQDDTNIRFYPGQNQVLEKEDGQDILTEEGQTILPQDSGSGSCPC